MEEFRNDPKFYRLANLRKVEEVKANLCLFKAQSSKEYFRSLVIKYFVEHPNVKIRLLQQLKRLEDIKITVRVNSKQYSRKFTLISILEIFANFCKESASMREHYELDFVEFFDSLEDLCRECFVIVDNQAPQKVRQLIIRCLIKAFYSKKNRKCINQNVQRMNKLYQLSFLKLGDGASEVINRQILVQFDKYYPSRSDIESLTDDIEQEQLEVSSQFDRLIQNDEINRSQSCIRKVRRLREQALQKHYEELFSKTKNQMETQYEKRQKKDPRENSGNKFARLEVQKAHPAWKDSKQQKQKSEEQEYKEFLEEWIGDMELSIRLFDNFLCRYQQSPDYFSQKGRSSMFSGQDSNIN